MSRDTAVLVNTGHAMRPQARQLNSITPRCPHPTDQLTKLFTSRLVVAQQCFKSEVLFPTGMLTSVCVSVCVCIWDFPGGSVVKNQPAMQETRVRSLAWEDPGEGHGSPLQYSYQDNTMDRAARRATVHGVT